MNKPLRFIVLAAAPLFLAALLAAQKIETVDGVRVVHNVKGGLWGKTPKVGLELVRKIGDVDTEDEHVAFNYPSDVASDKDGNIYILDSGNARIQKFGPDGKYLATIGRKGQGPGEFLMPDAIALDKDGNLVVADSSQTRIQVIIGGGKDVRSVRRQGRARQRHPAPASGGFRRQGLNQRILPAQPAGQGRPGDALLPPDRPDGRTPALSAVSPISASPRPTPWGTPARSMSTPRAPSCQLQAPRTGSRNTRPDGTLLWRADRPLDYGTEVKKKGKIEQQRAGSHDVLAGDEHLLDEGSPSTLRAGPGS